MSSKQEYKKIDKHIFKVHLEINKDCSDYLFLQCLLYIFDWLVTHKNNTTAIGDALLACRYLHLFCTGLVRRAASSDTVKTWPLSLHLALRRVWRLREKDNFWSFKKWRNFKNSIILFAFFSGNTTFYQFLHSVETDTYKKSVNFFWSSFRHNGRTVESKK